MIYTTLKDIKKHSPCQEGWKTLLKSLGKTKADDEPLPFEAILDSNGMDDALWCLLVLNGMEGQIRLLACDFAETALRFTTDSRAAEAIRVARLYAAGKATDAELSAAGSAGSAGSAGVAARSARAAWEAARAAARAEPWAAAGSARAAWEAARAAAWEAGWEAAGSARAAWEAARAAARAEPWAAAWEAGAAWDGLSKIFRDWLARNGESQG
jgi:hypothetical protein